MTHSTPAYRPSKTSTPPSVGAGKAAPIVYLVAYEPTTSNWVVRNGDSLSNVAAHRERDQAFIAAQQAARANEPSRLVVLREDGAIELEWNYGKRPYVARRKPPEALAKSK